MIDIRKLKELVRLMVENDLTELNLQDQAETVTVKRGYGGVPVIQQMPMGMAMPAAPVARAAAGGSDAEEDAGSAPGGSAPAAAASEAGLVAVTSPMVGTFYSSPNPDSPAFVNVGSAVTPETTVCLVEAMKVFNEIKAETAGTIERVLVQSGQSVEFGQKLFLIRPA
ncbi:MAG: acetyl-CoA carboxylase biotin carboxyl carrier protein [Planctomycetaceae bacterium]|jgi:acetyl-CoA carboxylase biotin carboxyl carrier protein|nr:acetyl-CoA carboxylase biotin carboxyl carrier protein [Planctomycetaceae bacterium]